MRTESRQDQRSQVGKLHEQVIQTSISPIPSVLLCFKLTSVQTAEDKEKIPSLIFEWIGFASGCKPEFESGYPILEVALKDWTG